MMTEDHKQQEKKSTKEEMKQENEKNGSNIERKNVIHPIPHNEKGGLLIVFSSPSKKTTNLILMCAGYPDDHSAFIPMAKRLVESGNTNCMVGVTCIPGYDDRPEDDMPWTAHPKDGYTFAEWATILQEAAKTLRAQVKSDELLPLTCVVHDWGCPAGLVFANTVVEKELKDLIPNQIVLLDVLLDAHPSVKPPPCKELPARVKAYKTVATLSYQLLFSVTFFVQRYLSPYLAAPVLMIGVLILMIFQFIDPTSIDNKYINEHGFKSMWRNMYCMYPYFKVYSARLLGRMHELSGMHLPLDLKAMPVLYMYGTEKPFTFHSPATVALLEDVNGPKQGGRCKVVPVEKAGHWLYWQQPDICQKEIEAFINEMMEGKKKK